MFATSYPELLELVVRVIDDGRLVQKADAVILYGQTPDNERSILEMGAFLFNSGSVDKVVFSTGGKSVAGQPWIPNYLPKLVGLGIPEANIVVVQITEELAHTCSEASAFVSYAQEQNWKTVQVTAAPVHQLRAFVSTVSILLKTMPKLKAYSTPGTSLPWTQVALHSQFLEKGRRCDLTQNEWRRIEKYHTTGDLVSARQVLDYLNQRDQ